MSTTSLDVAGPHLAALVEQLKKAGAIRSARWAEAFAAVPRHVFVPRWYEMEMNDKGISVWRKQHALHEGRLPQVYRDITLVTALDPSTAEKVDTDAWTGVPTSSSTLPSLMAGMLEDLHIQDGHRVLEVGTGTGYNTALLCARLGEHLVHTIDIDPELVSAAQSRLAKIGYEPQLVPGDGQTGYPTGERFDRIIATCSVHRHLPAAWIEQTSSDGIIVADIALGIEEDSSGCPSTVTGERTGSSPRHPAGSWPPGATRVPTRYRNGHRTQRRPGRAPPRSRHRTSGPTTPSACCSHSNCPTPRSSTTAPTTAPCHSSSKGPTAHGPARRSPATQA